MKYLLTGPSISRANNNQTECRHLDARACVFKLNQGTKMAGSPDLKHMFGLPKQACMCLL